MEDKEGKVNKNCTSFLFHFISLLLCVQHVLSDGKARHEDNDDENDDEIRNQKGHAIHTHTYKCRRHECRVLLRHLPPFLRVKSYTRETGSKANEANVPL